MKSSQNISNINKLKFARRLREDQTPAESKLWHIIRNRQIGGYKFRRQQPIGQYIVDFYCSQSQLVIEIDGDTHADQIEYDQARTKWLAKEGYKLIRFTNSDIHANLENVADEILKQCLIRSANTNG